MGELIYCKNSIAKTPYYIEDAGLNIYSLEELSYYIYNNPYLVDLSIMSKDFISWMSEELGEKESAAQLTELLNSNAPLHLYIGRVLNSCGYLSKTEIVKTMETIALIENKSDAECKKIRGDRWMDAGKIVDAIYEYESILNLNDGISDALEGDVCHNLGCAYARLFFFEQSIDYLTRAYEKNRRPDTLKTLLYSVRCSRNEKLYHELVIKYNVSDEMSDTIKNVLQEMEN